VDLQTVDLLTVDLQTVDLQQYLKLKRNFHKSSIHYVK
jgi:hypothetical protein